jgi:nucleoside-diphosphate-sugar epimerase
MRALVTGAGGFLGQALVRHLAGRGDLVRALVRRPAEGLLGPGVEVVLGDAGDPASLSAAAAGCDVLFHLAGIRRATDAAEFTRVNAGSTRVALEACLAAAPRLRRFVLAGSAAAGGPSREPRREDEPLAPVEPYGASKAEAERIALSYADRLPVTVLRPPRIMGPGDRENLFFFRIARAGLAVRFPGPPRPLSWIDVDDCARGFALAAERPEGVGEVFHLASPEATDATAIMEGVGEALGVKTRRVTIPAAALRAAAAASAFVTRLGGPRLPLNPKLAAQLLAPGWRCDPGKARARLGFEATTPLAASLAAAVRWYRERGLL